MIVLLISKSVADVFNENVYDLIMALKGLPYLEDYAEPYMRQLTVGDVVTGPLQIFHGFEKVFNVVHVLRTTRHNGFPVIDEPPFSESPVLYGLILRAHLLTLLKSKAFSQTPSPVSRDAIALFSADDFAKKGLGHDDRVEDLAFSDEEMEMYIDLHPFTNTSPYTVVETMSLGKALMLFRQVGLRHLLVTPRFSGVRLSALRILLIDIVFPDSTPFLVLVLDTLLFYVVTLTKVTEVDIVCLKQRHPVVGILTRHDFRPEHVLDLHPLLENSRWKRLRLRFPQLRKLV